MLHRSIPIATSHLPHFFTRFPARIHPDKDEIHRFTLELIKATKPEGSKEQKIALYRHGMTGSDMNVYALLWCEGDLERMKLVIEFFELIWDHDDLTEDRPLNESVDECEKLRRAMFEEFDDEPVADNAFGARVLSLRDLRNRIQALDPIAWADIRDASAAWLLTETQVKEWDSLEDYLQVRKVDVGVGVNAAVIRWMAGIHLTPYELALVQPYIDELGIWLSLMNDPVSWARESAKLSECTDRIMNSVHVVMSKHHLSEEAAMDLVRGKLVKQEGRVLGMGREIRERVGVSRDVRAFVENMECFAGGGFYWSILTPAYAA